MTKIPKVRPDPRFVVPVMSKTRYGRYLAPEPIYPTPEEVMSARVAAGLDLTEAGLLLHTSNRTFQNWERGTAKMHPAFWELFLRKLKELPE